MTTGSRIESLPQDETSLMHAFEAEGGVSLFGALGFLAGVATLLSQAYLWLRLGEWIPMPLSALFEWLGIDYSFVASLVWTDAQRIMVWIFDSPLSLVLIAFGFANVYLVRYVVTIFSQIESRLSQ